MQFLCVVYYYASSLFLLLFNVNSYNICALALSKSNAVRESIPKVAALEQMYCKHYTLYVDVLLALIVRKQ